MTPNCLFGFTVLLVCCFVEISTRPSNNESTVPFDEIDTEAPETTVDKEDKSIIYQTDTDIDAQDDRNQEIEKNKIINSVLSNPISYQPDTDLGEQDERTQEIIEKINTINSALNKPRRQQINYNTPYSEKNNGIDEETLEKIKQIIASEKLYPHSKTKSQPKSSNLLDDDRNHYSRAIKAVPNMFYPNQVQMMAYPYIMNYPVVGMPIANDMLTRYAANNGLKSVVSNELYQTKQQQEPLFPGFPSFPSFSFDNLFQFRPFSQLFPVIIKNPFVAFTQGGGFENFIEYGQSADVCSRKQKSSDESSENENEKGEENNNLEIFVKQRNDISKLKNNARESRALRKRTVLSGAPEQLVENKIAKKIHATTTTVRKTTKKPLTIKNTEDSKNNDYEGSLRFPFTSGFSLFGDKKPVAPSPGFFINKLRVRKGGVAIAGPGGVATAGRGGTAIVGPGGLAYTKPGGLAIAGPHARVVALSPYSDVSAILSRSLHLDDESRSLKSIREGKLVATGPVIYYHPTESPTKEILSFPA